MDGDFFKKALKWYNTVYVNPACERLVYFFLLLLSLFCAYYAIVTIDFVRVSKNYKQTYILMVHHKDLESSIRVSRLPSGSDSEIGIISFALTKYIKNFASLTYERSENAMPTLKKKMDLIRNLSSIDVYENYISNKYVSPGEATDVQLATLGLKKVVNIKNIKFFYEKRDIFSELYNKVIGDELPTRADVYFLTEITNGRNKKTSFVASVFFSFNERIDPNAGKMLEFKVNDISIRRV